MKIDHDLIRQLQTCGSGGSVHTRNKARCYYCWYKLNPKVRVELEKMIRTALATGDWSPLRIRMRKWF